MLKLKIAALALFITGGLTVAIFPKRAATSTPQLRKRQRFRAGPWPIGKLFTTRRKARAFSLTSGCSRWSRRGFPNSPS